MKINAFLFSCCFALFSNFSVAQEITDNLLSHQTAIRKTQTEIKIDGALEEAAWQQAADAKDFWEKWPRVAANVNPRTEVRLLYDDNFIYVAFTCFDSTNHVVQSLKRDKSFWSSDAVSILLDPVNEGTNGFLFGANVMGAQTEALISTGGSNRMNFDWDDKWYTASKRYDTYWTVEMAIPFKSIRYKAGKKKWGVNFIRNHIKGNQYHTWAPVPQQFPGIDLAYRGQLVWEEAPEKMRGNISIIPYVTGAVRSDFEEREDFAWEANGGVDAKIAISSALNLDLTVNPDFSQIEVDEQVTDLSRFSIFFPEKRTFFLENSDIFADFGIPPVRPFFSRRIGLLEGESVPILLGMRLSGNLNKDWRIGLMNMQTQTQGDLLGQNYTSFAFQRKLFNRSVVKGLFTNRQAFDGRELMSKDYGRNGGLEFIYTNKKGNWSAWSSYHHSFKDGYEDKNRFYNLGFNYSGRNFEALIDVLDMGTNYFADMGFVARIGNYDAVRDTVIRIGFTQSFSSFSYRFLPKERKHLNNHELGLENYVVFNPDGSFNEWNIRLRYFMNFINGTNLRFRLNHSEIDLLYPFSFTGDDYDPLPASLYSFSDFNIEYQSDNRKILSYTISAQYGGFYNGTRTSYNLGLNFRQQPWGSFGVRLVQNFLDFPDDYGKTSLLLIGPKMEISFNKNLFWTTFLQYNTQADNFNVNSRFQWRFQPMSDFFLVYTDNYGIDTFAPKNRALVFKLNYWLTI